MPFAPISDVWRAPESIRTMKHPAHRKQKQIMQEQKQFNEYKNFMSHQTPRYPWSTESRDRYLNGYYPPPEPKVPVMNENPWGSPFRHYPNIKNKGPSGIESMIPFEGFSNNGNNGNTVLLCLISFLMGLIIALFIIIILLCNKIK